MNLTLDGFKPAVKKLAKVLREIKDEFVDEFQPITVGDKANLYKEYRSFTGFLPYAEYLDECEMVLLEDHVSVACLWELEPIPSEGLDEHDIEQIESDFVKSLSAERDLEQPRKGSQFVLTTYVFDENSLDREYEIIANAIHPDWKNTELAKEYLASTKRMLKGMESEEGLFRETMTKGDSENASRAYRGGRRRHIAILYRRAPIKDRKGVDATRKKEIELLARMRSTFEATISARSIARRLNREQFYSVMVRMLNPSPASTFGDINRLLSENPCPSADLAEVDGDYAASMLHSRIETDSDNGVIMFDGHPARFLQVERMNQIPRSGALTAEKVGDNGQISAAFDNLPPGSIFVQQTVFEESDEVLESVVDLENKTQHNDDAAALTNEQCKITKKVLALGRKMHRTDMGVFIFGTDLAELNRFTDKVKIELINSLGLRAVSPENNLFPIESFIRHLPMVYDPALDNMRKRGKYAWFDHCARLIPLMGRTRGAISRTRKVCFPFFNRRGELIFFDPLDYDGNGHAVLLGPSGLGKSATLNKMIVELLLFKNARIFIAEAGESFDPLMDFLETEKMDVQRINIGTGHNSRPVAPLFNGKRARDEHLLNLVKDERMLDEEMKRMIAILELQNLPYQWLIEKIEEAKSAYLRSQEQFDVAREKDESDKEEKKDYLGECMLISRLMVTGGNAKEDDEWRRQDDAIMTNAVIDAANIADALQDQIMTPLHLTKALQANSKLDDIDSDKKRRISLMSDNVSIYTKSVRGQIFNQQCEPFKKCDCLHVELGVAQREGNEDMLALSYLSLMNMINNLAETKASEGDDRPIYVITDEAHLILKDPRIAPVAVKIVRMWRKYGAWFLAATQDFSQSFIGEARAILGVGEYFYAIKPPKDDLEILCELAKLDPNGLQAKLISRAKAEQGKFTEMIIVNKARPEANLVRIVQPSFTLAIAGTDPKEKTDRSNIMEKYSIRTAGASLVQAANIDLKRKLITKEQHEIVLEKIVNNPKYHQAA